MCKQLKCIINFCRWKICLNIIIVFGYNCLLYGFHLILFGIEQIIASIVVFKWKTFAIAGERKEKIYAFDGKMLGLMELCVSTANILLTVKHSCIRYVLHFSKELLKNKTFVELMWDLCYSLLQVINNNKMPCKRKTIINLAKIWPLDLLQFNDWF